MAGLFSFSKIKISDAACQTAKLYGLPALENRVEALEKKLDTMDQRCKFFS